MSDAAPNHYRALARYNRWMNDKLYAVCAELGDEDRKRDRGAYFASIHGTLNHLLLGDRIWLGRFKSDPSFVDGLDRRGHTLSDELYADFEELHRERAKTDEELAAWVANLTPQSLDASLRYVRKGTTHESPLWHAVMHLFNHQTHHRGQVTTLLYQAGKDPGVTDLVAMLREEAA